MNLQNKFIAHRGFYDEYIPENSIQAFKKCLYRNIPIEIDVHLTKDKKVVVFHDFNLKRMTKLDKNIEDTTYDEIKDLKLNDTEETIPLLIEVLCLIKNKVPIIIEIKNKKVGPLEKELIKILDSYNNFYLQTFKMKSINYLKRKRPNYKIGIILFKNKLLNIKKIDFICCYKIGIVSSKIQKYRQKLKIIVWTINNKEEYEIFKNYGDFYMVNMKKVYNLYLTNI